MKRQPSLLAAVLIAGAALQVHAMTPERWQTLPPTPAAPEARVSGVAAVNGIRMYYARYGTGRSVLLLHGGLGNSNYWGNIIPRLVARHFEVIVADSRGHGRSTRSAAKYSYALMADDIVALLDTLNLGRVDIVGWSDGGIVGLDLAMRHPERLNRLAIYGANSDPGGVREDVDKSAVFGAYLQRTRTEYAQLSPTPDDYDRFVNDIDTMWRSEPRYGADELRRIHTPTLVFDGAHDEAIKREHAEYLARSIPGARLVILEDVSHFGMLQNPAEFARTIVAFLLAH